MCDAGITHNIDRITSNAILFLSVRIEPCIAHNSMIACVGSRGNRRVAGSGLKHSVRESALGEERTFPCQASESSIGEKISEAIQILHRKLINHHHDRERWIGLSCADFCSKEVWCNGEEEQEKSYHILESVLS